MEVIRITINLWGNIAMTLAGQYWDTRRRYACTSQGRASGSVRTCDFAIVGRKPGNVQLPVALVCRPPDAKR